MKIPEFARDMVVAALFIGVVWNTFDPNPEEHYLISGLLALVLVIVAIIACLADPLPEPSQILKRSSK